jgi:hypothetical protein
MNKIFLAILLFFFAFSLGPCEATMKDGKVYRFDPFHKDGDRTLVFGEKIASHIDNKDIDELPPITEKKTSEVGLSTTAEVTAADFEEESPRPRPAPKPDYDYKGLPGGYKNRSIDEAVLALALRIDIIEMENYSMMAESRLADRVFEIERVKDILDKTKNVSAWNNLNLLLFEFKKLTDQTLTPVSFNNFEELLAARNQRVKLRDDIVSKYNEIHLLLKEYDK